MEFPERDFEFDDSSESSSEHKIDTSGEEEEAGDIVEAWLSGQTWYLLAGLLMGFVFNMVSRLTAVQRVASSSPATAGPTAGNAASLWTSNFVSSNYPRMYFVVRTDLKMGGGKIASQTAHAAIMCYKKAARNRHRAGNGPGSIRSLLENNREIKTVVNKCLEFHLT